MARHGQSHVSPIRAMRGEEPPWARPYSRERDLPRLLPLLADDLPPENEPAGAALLGLLRRALRRERNRSLQGHWTYDPARHAALVHAYRHEAGRAADAGARRAG